MPGSSRSARLSVKTRPCTGSSPPIPEKDERTTFSALFAYKLNWQTVLYAGYGDQRTFEPVTDELQASGRQWFTKISYAYQR